MSVCAVSSGATPSAQPVRPSSRTSQVGSDFKSLADALQSGDLAAAQQALAALQQDMPAMHGHHHHHRHQAQAQQQQAAAITPSTATAAAGSGVNVLA